MSIRGSMTLNRTCMPPRSKYPRTSTAPLNHSTYETDSQPKLSPRSWKPSGSDWTSTDTRLDPVLPTISLPE